MIPLSYDDDCDALHAELRQIVEDDLVRLGEKQHIVCCPQCRHMWTVDAPKPGAS